MASVVSLRAEGVPGRSGGLTRLAGPHPRALLRSAAVALMLAAIPRLPAGDPGAQAPAPRSAAPQAAIRQLADGAACVDGITVDPRTRSATFAATMNLGHGVLEVIIATPGGRLHEALLKADVSPLKLQALLYTLGLNNGPRLRDSTGRRGDLVDIDLEYAGADGKAVREPVESWIRDSRTGGPMKRIGWVFTGSTMRDGVFLAEEEGNICINYSVGSTILDCPDTESLDDTIHVVESSHSAPGVGAAVKVIVTAREKTP